MCFLNDCAGEVSYLLTIFSSREQAFSLRQSRILVNLSSEYTPLVLKTAKSVDSDVVLDIDRLCRY